MGRDDGCPASSEPTMVAFDLCSAAVLGTVLFVVFATWRDYGITWDEHFHLEYGDYVLNWWRSLGEDQSALSYRRDYFYGGGFDLFGAVARRILNLPRYDAIHLVGALLGVLGLAGAWRLARRLGGPPAGLATLVLLALTPAYYGHMFNNPKDLPFAVGYVWGLWAICRFAQAWPSPRRRDWILVAMTLGLGMSVRIGGLLLVIFFVGTWAVLLARRAPLLRLATARAQAIPVAATVVAAWLIMLAAWPWAQLDPLRRPIAALGLMSRFTLHVREMAFAGETISTLDTPRTYLVHYLGLKLPLLVLALLVAGLLLAAWRAWRTTPARADRRRDLIAVVALAAALPVGYAMAVGSVLYDGMRHFLFVVPPLCVLAGLTLAAIPRLLWPRARLVVAGAVALSAIMCARQLYIMVQLHPHQYVFFNRLAGGLPGAAGRYSTDYYGNSYKEGFERLTQRLWNEDPHVYLESTFVISACMPTYVAREYLPGNFTFKPRGRDPGPPATYYVAYTRSGCDKRHANNPIVETVQRQGVPLAIIRDLRQEELGL